MTSEIGRPAMEAPEAVGSLEMLGTTDPWP